jgi:hypothetical protein
MSETEPVPPRLKDQIDDYLNGQADEAGMTELEGALRADAEARRYFVRYARLHTDLHLEMRARVAGENALNKIERLIQAEPAPLPPSVRSAFLGRLPIRWVGTVAALIVLGLGALWALRGGRVPDAGSPGPAVAWLVNAQNCTWADDVAPAGDMGPGTVLKVERGLAEIRFRCGARVVLEGPARLELRSDKSARLLRGKLTARVSGPATGFEVLSPQGKVIDLGTEFGVAVSGQGATDVYVFEGKVEAFSTDAGNGRSGAVRVKENQSARIADGKVVVQQGGAGQFVRAIVPPPVIRPRTLRLTFDRETDGGVRDAAGRGTGLTHRLPNTGGQFPPRDPNLRLDTSKGLLELTTTNTDINNQFKLAEGEYLGVRLADLGFTGAEDFEVRVTVPDIPALENYGQFGLYAGTDSALNIRGGLINSKWKEPGQNTQFLVNNDGGRDSDIYRIGLLSPGDDLRLTLKRVAGKYSLTVENLTDGSTSTLTIRHPHFLNDRGDLYVGLFGANAQSNVRKTLLIREFQATVWTVAAPPQAAAAP